MNVVELIAKKKAGGQHSPEELDFLVQGVVTESIEDYQATAWLMAVCWRGLSATETTALTLATARSGQQLDLTRLGPHVVDKHSTGGVGDKTTLIVGPVCAAAGATVAKLSGRGLGHTGGTVDKLEAIPGLRTQVSVREFVDQARKLGLVLAGTSVEFAPADKKIYAWRDATATVDSLPLIAASVMSKKLAAGSPNIVLDVKAGGGAFIKEVESAKDLAQLMVEIGAAAGRRVRAVVTAMNEPLGRAVGTAIEVEEVLRALRGEAPEDLTELCVFLSAEMLVSSGVTCCHAEGAHLAQEKLESGRALDKFLAMVRAQGGDVGTLQEPAQLPRAAWHTEVKASSGGYVEHWDALAVGMAAWATGAGRTKVEDSVDPGAGVLLQRKRGEQVVAGGVVAELWASTQERLETATELLGHACVVGAEPPSREPLVLACYPLDERAVNETV